MVPERFGGNDSDLNEPSTSENNDETDGSLGDDTGNGGELDEGRVWDLRACNGKDGDSME
jgi:hypothetical protein